MTEPNHNVLERPWLFQMLLCCGKHLACYVILVNILYTVTMLGSFPSRTASAKYRRKFGTNDLVQAGGLEA